MKLFKMPSNQKIGNLIITIFTAIVSTFFMQSCMNVWWLTVMKELKISNIKFLVIHCSATKANQPFSVESLVTTGKEKFGQCSYHYYITRKGFVFKLLPLSVQGAHVSGYNSCSVGICYEGGYDANGHPADTRTETQRTAILDLLKDLKTFFPTARIVGHCELPGVAKSCPCFIPSKEYASLWKRAPSLTSWASFLNSL